MVETLTKQIIQTKTNLGYLAPNAVKTGKSKQQQAEDKVATALLDYQQTIDKASLEFKSGVATEADVKKKQLSAQERLYDAYGDAYSLYKDPKYKDAQDKAAEEIVKLGGEVKAATEAQEAARKAARELESAQKKLADAQQKLAEAQSTGSATAIYQAQKNVDKQQAVVNRLQNPTLPATPQPTGFEAMKQSVQAEIKFDQMNVDEATLKTLLTTAIQNGLNEVTVDYAGLQAKIAQGIDIPESTWKELQDEINAKLKEIGVDKILNIDFSTGSNKQGKDTKSSDELSKINQDVSKITSGIGGIFSGIQQMGIEIPEGISEMLGVLQGITTIMTAITTILSVIEATSSVTATTSAVKAIPVVGWALANGGVVHAEGGYKVPGNHMSGDMVPAMLNSGEMVLNRFQQQALAGTLENGGMKNISISGHLEGETIALSVDRWGKRSGRGELAFWKNQ